MFNIIPFPIPYSSKELSKYEPDSPFVSLHNLKMAQSAEVSSIADVQICKVLLDDIQNFEMEDGGVQTAFALQDYNNAVAKLEKSEIRLYEAAKFYADSLFKKLPESYQTK